MRVAAWQCRPGSDPAQNLRRLEQACAEAAERGAEVLVTPEMFTTGYALAPPDLARRAEDPGGPTETAAAEIASRTGVAVAYGYPERTPGGEVYNAATLVGPGGVVVGRHRKVHLFGDFDRRLFRPNPEPPAAFDVPRGRAGLLICYDVEFPETVRHLAADGARVVLVPTANMTGYEEVPLEIVPRHARDNGCAIVYANYVGADEAFAYGGLSVICGPSGEVLAQAGPAAEELLVKDITIFLSITDQDGCPDPSRLDPL